MSVIWWTALLWHAMCNPFIYFLEHVESRCGQVSIWIWVYGRLKDNRHIYMIAMNSAYQNVSICIICALEMVEAFQKWYERL